MHEIDAHPSMWSLINNQHTQDFADVVRLSLRRFYLTPSIRELCFTPTKWVSNNQQMVWSTCIYCFFTWSQFTRAHSCLLSCCCCRWPLITLHSVAKACLVPAPTWFFQNRQQWELILALKNSKEQFRNCLTVKTCSLNLSCPFFLFFAF